MRRIDTITKKQIQDKNGKNFDGFVEGDPSEGVEPTHLSDSWCNNLQEEICNVIEGIGNSVNKETTVAQDGSNVREEKYDQMLQAIKLLAETGTPIGSVKPMSVKMNPNFIARWVPAKRSEKGATYLSEEMATNCEQVDGNTGRFYKLVTGDRQSGEGSGAFGWALADGKFPLPIELFGQDDETRPKTEEEKNKEEGVISDTEYGKIWKDENERHENGDPIIKNDRGWVLDTGLSNNWYVGFDEPLLDHIAEHRYYGLLPDFFQRHHIKEEDLLPRKNSVPADDEDVWENNPKPKLIPNLNDKTFLMGSSEENLPLILEGKNGFMMQPCHMPPHSHLAGRHEHAVSVNDGTFAQTEYDPDTLSNTLKTSALTGSEYTSTETFSTGDNIRTFGVHTGGYCVSPTSHNEGGAMQGKHLYGAVPIDLRPKRLQVYYYIRVI